MAFFGPVLTLGLTLLAILGLYQQAPPPGTGQGGGEGSGGGGQQGGGQQGGGNGQQGGQGGQGGTPPPVTFTPEQQAHIDAVMARTRNEGKRAGETEAEARHRQAQEETDRKAREAQQQFEPLYNTEKEARARDREAFTARLISTSVEHEARALGFINPATAARLIDRAAITVGEDFTVSGVKEALETLKAAEPYMVAAANGGQGGGAGQGAGTGAGGQGGQGAGAGAGTGQQARIPGTPRAADEGVRQPGEGMTPEQAAHIEALKTKKRAESLYARR